MRNDPHITLSQPGREIILSAIIEEVRDERGELLRGVDRHHEHLRILTKGGRILSKSKKPEHGYALSRRAPMATVRPLTCAGSSWITSTCW